ncbi:MAG: AraC family transcriptional regulator [Myxococcales bacterium]
MGTLTVTKLRCGKESQLVDVACTLGRRDRPYPEIHGEFAVALVRRGTFRYRAAATNRVHQLPPGWLLFGVEGATFECSHEHDGGDDCTSLALSASVLADVSSAAGLCCSRLLASAPALPPLPRAAVLLERARRSGGPDLDELSCLVAESVAAHASGVPLSPVARHPSHAGRVHDAIERIEAGCTGELSLGQLASDAGLSSFHFLRVFRHVTDMTPHQYLIGARVRLAARMLLDTERSVTEIAYAVGFNDLSNFMRTFRRVVGETPRDYRRS